MKYTTSTKKVNISDEHKEKMMKKLNKFDKFFHDEAEAFIMIREQKDALSVEVTISFNGLLLRAEERNRDLMIAIDRIVAQLERQLRKNKTKLARQLRTGAGEALAAEVTSEPEVEDEKEEFKIIRSKRFSAKPMLAEEAILQMNLLGHDFFVYTNPDTDELNVVYKRKDRDYGLIVLE